MLSCGHHGQDLYNKKTIKHLFAPEKKKSPVKSIRNGELLCQSLTSCQTNQIYL